MLFRVERGFLQNGASRFKLISSVKLTLLGSLLSDNNFRRLRWTSVVLIREMAYLNA